jgi:hypothetical protein
MYANFFNHLLLRLPHHLALRVLQQLSQLACGSPLPSVAWEASSMFKTAGMVLPAETEELVLQPLIKKLTAELPEAGECGGQGNLTGALSGGTWRAVSSNQAPLWQCSMVVCILCSVTLLTTVKPGGTLFCCLATASLLQGWACPVGHAS